MESPSKFDSFRDKIAQKLLDAIDTDTYAWVRGNPGSIYSLAVDGDVDTGVLADAILPLIREAQADALEEASSLIEPFSGIGLANGATRHDVSEWLRERAAAYRVGEGQHG